MQNPDSAQESNRLSIGKAAKYLGVSIDTLRRWEKKEVIKAYRSPGGHRYFLDEDLDKLFNHKYTRVAPTKKREKIDEIKPTEQKSEDPPQTETSPLKQEKAPQPQPEKETDQTPVEPERIEPALSEPIRPPQPVKAPEAKPIPTTQQAIPAQDTPATFPTTTYQSVSTVPAAGLEQKARDIVKTKKPLNIPWTKALVIGLIIFGVVDVILFIVFLTSSRAPISPIP